MDRHFHKLVAAIAMPLLLAFSGTSFSATQTGQADLFDELEHEDSSVPEGRFWADNLSTSEFSAMEIELEKEDVDLFDEREHEDHSIEW